MAKQKLELTWIGKGEEINAEPRILLYDKEKSYGDQNTENMLIHGDNLLALKALEQEYAGRVKCIYIDPPYNTGSAFEHYDDNLEHSIWLQLLHSRLVILNNLLSDDGSIWITLDDTEAHYCKVLCDEIFGRKNFLADIIWEKADSPKMDAKTFSSRHDHILVYAKDATKIMVKRIISEEIPPHYNKIDERGRAYYLKPLRAMGVDGFREKRPALFFAVKAPDGQEVYPKNQDGSDSRWRWSADKVEKEKDRLEWIKGKSGWSLYFRIYHDDSIGTPPETIWKHADVGSNRTSKKENKDLFGSDIFDTPKPESLINRIIHIATNPGDLVLDSFLGSGTTAAVAHKMGRRYIGIELGDHCYTHCLPRLQKVVDGEQGGISKAVNWQGGGGFRFYELAPSLLKKDSFGNWIIDSEVYSADLLAAAVAKLNGYYYVPDETAFWKQGKSMEQSYIFTTTQYVTAEYLDNLSKEMEFGDRLLVCCPAFDTGLQKRYDNIVIKKIPQSVLDKCEYGKSDYNLNIIDTDDFAEEDYDELEL